MFRLEVKDCISLSDPGRDLWAVPGRNSGLPPCPQRECVFYMCEKEWNRYLMTRRDKKVQLWWRIAKFSLILFSLLEQSLRLGRSSLRPYKYGSTSGAVDVEPYSQSMIKWLKINKPENMGIVDENRSIFLLRKVHTTCLW